jgi:hypothetical protein
LKLRLPIASAAGLFLAVWLLSGCWTVSVNPWFSDDTLTYDERLLGTWQRENLVIVFTPDADNTYRLQLIDEREKDKVELLKGRLVKLGDLHYLDLAPLPAEEEDVVTVHRIDGHSIWKVFWQGDALRLTPLDFDWLHSRLEENPKSLSAARVEKYFILLTASTAELQEFVKGNAQQAFRERETDLLQRVPATKKK